MDELVTETEAPLRRSWPAFACAGFVLLAVIVELTVSQNAGAVAPRGFSRFAPAAWPDPLRVMWWLAVAAAAGGYRLFADLLGGRKPRWALVAVSAAPFAFFAVGIALGSGWATYY